MALDFAVLTEDETSADIVSLGMLQHDALMTLAEQLGLEQILRFEDYCEEIDLRATELPQLSEELNIIGKSTASSELREFACKLNDLIALAVRRKKLLSAVPD